MNQTHEDSNIGLTMEDKIVALLKWMGWKLVDDNRTGRPSHWDDIHYQQHGNQSIPPLTLDLMAEAVKKLDKSKHEHVSYAYRLLEITTYDEIGQVGHILALSEATKEQRLEALVKTISGTA